ncbi:serine/threonine-protein kinase [Streptomyces sp. DSM 41524]|uniref:non-specific serine/threonine protein kinase n=1 Tax=Streptomyces asiaticus subsp. ignotus TaxID=3098222 RepID=A0ABU7QC30_9ACTN|nr:serine/threonine-protein kinase [Streptomyces sp. DSM 41524]
MDSSTLIGGHLRLKDGPVSGAMGDVWTAEDTRLGRTVAVKFFARRRLMQQGVPTEFAESTARMFQREGQAMARLNHRRVAQIFGGGEHDGEFYIVMEYVEGRSLAEYLRAGPRLPLERTVRWTRQICEGVGAAHTAEVIHRDIKPDNIMITRQGDVKLIDFGLAYLTDANQTHTVAGTPLYKAPERWLGETGNERSDLYSVGCVLYEMLTGRPPFGTPQDDAMTVGRMHQDDVPAPPSAHRPGVPAQLDSLVRALLAKDPAERPGNAQKVAHAVGEILNVLDVTDDLAGRADAPDAHGSNAGLSRRIEALDSRIFELELRFEPSDQPLIDARAEHADLTGQSGDTRGAAALYNQLARDCQSFFGPYDVRTLDAFEGLARWNSRARTN